MDPFKFEDNFQNVCFTGLTTRGVPHGTTRANVVNAQDRVDVIGRSFHKASNKMAQSVSNVWFHSHYEGEVAFDVFTQRGGANSANHNVWVSNIRSMMSRANQFFTLSTLPCYHILRVEETPNDPEQVEKTDADHTPLTFLVGVEIIGSQVA